MIEFYAAIKWSYSLSLFLYYYGYVLNFYQNIADIQNWGDTGKYENENKIHSTLTFVWLSVGMYLYLCGVCVCVCTYAFIYECEIEEGKERQR